MGYQNNALLRLHALGNFKTMTRAVTIDPGMLRSLNGYLNTASAPRMKIMDANFRNCLR